MTEAPRRRLPWPLRALLAAFGMLCVGLGLAGVFIPGLPTTIFMIMAVWAFGRSSPRFEAWLIDHPRFGPPLRAWRREGAISRRGKRFSAIAIAASWVIIVLTFQTLLVAVAAALGLGAVVAFIWTRPDPADE